MICPYCKKEIEPIEETTSEITVGKDAKGRIKTWTEVRKDTDGNRISKRVDSYTYYPTGEIDTIIQKVYGSIDSLISKENKIKHCLDGRQPSITIIQSKQASL